jgi:hypothetical protein
MQVVSEEFSTLVPAMAIINTEKAAFWPIINFSFLALGFHNVQYDSHTVLIVVSKKVKSGLYLTIP